MITLGYLDPGAGSILLQVALAGLAAFGVALKCSWRWLATLGRAPARARDESRTRGGR